MKEIGGYFGLDTFAGEEYHSNLIKLNNARNALLYVLKARNVRRLYIPWFLCDSVSKMCDRYGYDYEYYHIDRSFMPVFDRKLDADEYLYVVNFYGQLSNEVVRQLQVHHRNIILDNVHAFFQKPMDGIDTIYSCRKFFGVPDGGYLATNVLLDEELPRDVSADRMKHILGRYEGKASDFYGDFKANDRSFVEVELREMSDLTKNLLRAIDYETVRRKRNENYAQLHIVLKEMNGIQPNMPDGPYAYPLYCENGMEIKSRLAKKGIFIATLWPNVLKSEAELEIDFTKNILPIPCDQRYDDADMRYLLDCLLQGLD